MGSRRKFALLKMKGQCLLGGPSGQGDIDGEEKENNSDCR